MEWPLIFTAYFCGIFLNFISARKLPDIYWNSTNPMFDISNTEHVKTVKIMDRVTIICPSPSNMPYEYSKLFVVSRDGYDRCELRNERLLGICATPNKPASISLVFRDFSPLPSALEFKPGRSYYVITTSEGTYSGINNTEGGLCSTKSMRIKFDVVSDDSTRLSIDNRDLAALRGSLNVDSPDASKSEDFIDQEPDSPIMYVIHTDDPEISQQSSSVSDGEQKAAKIAGDDNHASRATFASIWTILLILWFLRRR